MSIAIPEEHKEENLKLTGEDYVDLFEIILLSGSVLRLKTGDTVNWNGSTWESFPIELSGYEISSEKSSRPMLKVPNPESLFSSTFLSGELEKARVNRYRVLRRDIDDNLPISQKLTWILWQIKQITSVSVEMELRNPTDGNNFDVPARKYMPPDFPSTRLQ